MLALKFLCAHILVLDVILEHMVDRSGDLIGCSNLSMKGAALGALTPIESSKRARTSGDGSSRLTKCLACTIIAWQRP